MQDTVGKRSRRNVIAGAVFVLIAALFAVQAIGYPLGTPIRMGPGFWPLLLACLLGLLGIVVLVTGLRENEFIEVSPVPWVAMGMVLVSLVLFGLLARQFGLVPIVFVCTALTAFASKNNTLVSSLTIAAIMALVCYLIFKVGLGITLPTFGPLFAF